MCDVVVTVPKSFTHPAAPGKRGLAAWLAEGDPPGSEWSGMEWMFTTYGCLPFFTPGDRCYVTCGGRVVGYAPLIRVMYEKKRFRNGRAPLAFVRGGGAVAVTINEPVAGFRGWRARWWDRCEEFPLDLADILGPRAPLFRGIT